MLISVKRTGGFAGLTEALGSVDTAQLDEATGRQVEQLVRSVGFFSLPTSVAGAVGADLYRYEISVTDGERRHSVVFEDDGSAATAPLRELVATVTDASRRVRGPVS